MSIVKVSELSGAALDWAVAKCEGHTIEHAGGKWFYIPMMDQDKIGAGYSPSTQWWRGGPIIERERIHVYAGPQWTAVIKPGQFVYGPAPLIAAMRCYVASELGETVEVPEELC